MKKHGIVSRITTGGFRYQAWPTVTKGEDGTLYAASSAHRMGHICPFGKNYMYVSHDNGESWTAPQIINDTWLDDRDAGLLAWGEGNLLLSWFNHPTQLYRDRENVEKHTAILKSKLSLAMRERWESLDETEYRPGSFTSISRDNGKTWSAPRQLPVTAPHGPIRKKDGSLFYVGRAFQWKGLEEGIYAYESFDDGETWNFVSQLPQPKDLPGLACEPYSIEFPDGEIMAGVRYQHPDFPGKLKTYTTFSQDGGKTWEEPTVLDLLGAPPHMLLHSSGALIMVYGRRIAPMGQYARISYDQGRTWSNDVMISPEAPDWDQGYPSSVELEGGDVLTVYYQKVPGDSYASLLSTRWSISDLF